jgi:hypothetical protein
MKDPDWKWVSNSGELKPVVGWRCIRLDLDKAWHKACLPLLTEWPAPFSIVGPDRLGIYYANGDRLEDPQNVEFIAAPLDEAQKHFENLRAFNSTSIWCGEEGS